MKFGIDRLDKLADHVEPMYKGRLVRIVAEHEPYQHLRVDFLPWPYHLIRKFGYAVTTWAEKHEAFARWRLI